MNRLHSPYDQVVYDDGTLQIGRFWIPVEDRNFADTGPIQNHILVIPSRAVEISYSRRESAVADPTVAMCYNRGCEYRRRALNPRGDLSWWFAYHDEMLAEFIGGSPERPFRRRWQSLAPDAFIAARGLVAEFARAHSPDRLRVQECCWWLLGRCLDAERTAPNCTARQRKAIERARSFMAVHFREPLSLRDIAAAACMSPFHLSRQFHRLMGKRLHQYLVELRLREAVPEVMEPSASLTDIAINLGFSSPSHFSSAFRASFGMSPSRLRKSAPGRSRSL